MPFGDLSKVKLSLGIPDNSEDNLLLMLMDQVSTAIENWCERKFGFQQSFTEYYSGNGTVLLLLNQRPVYSITSIYQDNGAFWGAVAGSYPSTTLLVSGEDYALQLDGFDGLYSATGIVQSLNGPWMVPVAWVPGVISPMIGAPSGNIKATYVGNNNAVPGDIQLALNMQIATVRNMKNYGQALASESRGDGAGSQSYSTALKSVCGFFSQEVTSVLARHRNVAIA